MIDDFSDFRFIVQHNRKTAELQASVSLAQALRFNRHPAPSDHAETINGSQYPWCRLQYAVARRGGGEQGGETAKDQQRKKARKRERASNTHTHTHFVLRQDSKTRTLNWTKAPVTAPTQHKCDIQHCSGGLTTPSSCSKILLPSVVPSSPELYTSTHFAAPLGLFRAS